MGVSSAQDDIKNYEFERQIVTSYVPRLPGEPLATNVRMLAEGTGTMIERVNDY